MSEDGIRDGSALYRRAHGEMLDSFDEELEMEIDDGRMERLLDDMAEHPDELSARAGIDRNENR
jgi:polyphosphate kinase